MARYILICNESGHIFGDSANITGGLSSTPTQVAAVLDASVGLHDRTYSELRARPSDGRTGYLVYRADIDGSDVVPFIHDGQDRDTIEQVERMCEYVCFVEASDV